MMIDDVDARKDKRKSVYEHSSINQSMTAELTGGRLRFHKQSTFELHRKVTVWFHQNERPSSPAYSSTLDGHSDTLTDEQKWAIRHTKLTRWQIQSFSKVSGNGRDSLTLEWTAGVGECEKTDDLNWSDRAIRFQSEMSRGKEDHLYRSNLIAMIKHDHQTALFRP